MPPDEKPCAMQTTGHCPQVLAAADVAVKRTFAILGVDVDDPKGVEEFRQDLRFGSTLRRASERGFTVMMATMLAGMVAGTCSLLWLGLKAKLLGGVGP